MIRALVRTMQKAITEVENDVTALTAAARFALDTGLIRDKVNEIKAAEQMLERFNRPADNYDWWYHTPPCCDMPFRRPTKVYFIQRPDQSLYATTKNRHLPGEIVIDTLMATTHPNWSIRTSPVVASHLKHLAKR